MTEKQVAELPIGAMIEVRSDSNFHEQGQYEQSLGNACCSNWKCSQLMSYWQHSGVTTPPGRVAACRPFAPSGSDTPGHCRVLVLARTSSVGHGTRRQSPTLSLIIIRRCG